MKIENVLKVFKTALSWIIFLIAFYIIVAVVSHWWGIWDWWGWQSIIPILAVSIGSLTLIYILKKLL